MRKIAKIFKAVGDVNRLRILKMLELGPMCVYRIAHVLGLSQSATSRHLRILEDAGLVLRRRTGLLVRYSLSRDRGTYLAPELLELISECTSGDPTAAQDMRRAKEVKRNPASGS